LLTNWLKSTAASNSKIAGMHPFMNMFVPTGQYNGVVEQKTGKSQLLSLAIL